MTLKYTHPHIALKHIANAFIYCVITALEKVGIFDEGVIYWSQK